MHAVETSSVASVSPGDRLATSTVLLFSVPALGQGFLYLFTGMYLLKFSTDVLGIAPATMGLLFFVSRVWDAVSDPLAGYLSDRTSTRFGRRRPWLFASAIPFGLSFYAMWAPPESLDAQQLAVWMGVSILVFYTCGTIYNVPHDSLAAELSDSYEDRNRIFGIRRALFGVGTIFVFVAVSGMSASSDPRGDARLYAIVAGLVTAVSIVVTAIGIRERPGFQGRGAREPFRAFAEVFRNPHARVLLGVFFLQQIGVGVVTVMAAYYAQYILGDPAQFAPMIGVLFAVSLVSIPVWIRLGRRYDKKSILLFSMCVVGGALFSMGFFGKGDLTALMVVCGLAGAAIGGLDVVFPSMQADVIDYDELRSNERKEGVYFAAWAFAAKTALGISGMLAGLALAGVDYSPGAEQPESVRWTIRILMSGVPLLTYGGGILLFRRFGLTREAHDEIRSQLALRRPS
jgi:GPH family glycoside/pentoside/hexuronide:cation symporter